MIVFEPADHTPGKAQGMLSSLIVPRPIAMISTESEDGVVNVAPYSYFCPITGDPALIAVTMGGRRADRTPKHSWANATRTGDFVINVTTAAMMEHIEIAAMEFPADVSESELVGWTPIPSQKVSHPSIAESPAHLECEIRQVVDLGVDHDDYAPVHLVVAEVVCIVMDESICTPDYRVDVRALQPIGRMTFPYFTEAADGLFGLERITYSQYAETGVLPGRIHD